MSPRAMPSRLAWASLICGLAALLAAPLLLLVGLPLFSIFLLYVTIPLAFILGVLAHRRIRRSTVKLGGRRAATAGIIASVAAFILYGFIVPAAAMVQGAAMRMRSVGNLKQIGLALHAYADRHGGKFPPAFVCDAQGHRLYSWRVLILPYLEQDDLYKQFKLDEPWDSPHNLALLPRMPLVYAPPKRWCVSYPPNSTFYQVFVGPGAAFEGGEAVPLSSFTDGVSDTILIAEGGQAVPWTKPEDLTFAADLPLPALGGLFRGGEGQGFNAAFGDGHVAFYHQNWPGESKLRALITRNGGEKLDSDW